MKFVNRMRKSSLALSVGLMLSVPISSYSAQAEEAAVANVRLIETTDVHANYVNYDYYQDQETNEFGLVKTAELIKQARQEAKNSLLFDNGDLIQGTPLADYVAKVDVLQDGETHPAYKVMNLMKYDAGNIGNHEFNYGLDFLHTALAGADFPYVNSNVYVDDRDSNPDNDKNLFTPYVILDRTIVDENGAEHPLKVGVIGFVPPQIMQWDKAHLEGKVVAKDIVESANKFVPEMKAAGADIVVAIPHSGIGSVASGFMKEDATYDLSKVKGIDAILFGHTHSVFPSEEYADIPGVDIAKGTINGVAAVMPGFWGNHVGIVDLKLEKKNGKWTVVDRQTEARPITDEDGNPLVGRDESLFHAVQDDHEATLDYIRGPVGKTTAPINSYFSQVQDDPSIQIVNNAQIWYVEKHIQGTEYEGLPVLSAGAPFKAGTRGEVTYYTDIPAGTIAIKNVADLYLYPNTLSAVLLNGAQVKDWLEKSAGQFLQVDPAKSGEQPLVNMDYRSYNFDVIDGVEYQIDVSKPAKYDKDGNVVNKEGRIVHLTFKGKPVKPDQKFIVATNNYRANGGGKFPGLDGTNVIIASPDESRQIIIDYIRERGTINPSADGNWSFAPIKGQATITFETSPKGQKYLNKLPGVAYMETLKSGFAKYSIDLSGEKAVPAGKPGGAGDTVYVVKSGDTLSHIGLRHGIEWRRLAEYNKLQNPHLIYIGQKIRIPGK